MLDRFTTFTLMIDPCLERDALVRLQPGSFYRFVREIRSMGDHFAGVWQGNHCPATLKKMIFRTVIEEIIVRTDQDKKTLELVIHWKGGTHTQLAMERPRSATETATPMEALEIIRRMAVRYGDDQIASVLNRCGYSTGKGKRWNQIRVATAQRNHSIAGQQ